MDDPQIREINKTYLKRNRPTDVISFSQLEGAFTHLNACRLLGDVVISLETAKRQARESNRTLEDEITFLLIHGILHLLGYDHEGSAEKTREMRARERELMNSLTSRGTS